MATRDEVKTMVLYMKNLYPNYHPVLDGQFNTIDALEDQLGHLPIDTLRAAVRAACAKPGREFAPSSGEILGAAAELHARASGMPTAAEAWGAVMANFGQAPGDMKKYLSNPLVQKAVDCMGGMQAIGQSENNMADRAHFLKIYSELEKRALADAAELPQVTAYIESRQLEAGKEIKQLTDRMEAK